MMRSGLEWVGSSLTGSSSESEVCWSNGSGFVSRTGFSGTGMLTSLNLGLGFSGGGGERTTGGCVTGKLGSWTTGGDGSGFC